MIIKMIHGFILNIIKNNGPGLFMELDIPMQKVDLIKTQLS